MTLHDIMADAPPAIRIQHPWGFGEWHHEADRKRLQAYCNLGNAAHGEGTHRIVSERPQ